MIKVSNISSITHDKASLTAAAIVSVLLVSAAVIVFRSPTGEEDVARGPDVVVVPSARTPAGVVVQTAPQDSEMTRADRIRSCRQRRDGLADRSLRLANAQRFDPSGAAAGALSAEFAAADRLCAGVQDDPAEADRLTAAAAAKGDPAARFAMLQAEIDKALAAIDNGGSGSGAAVPVDRLRSFALTGDRRAQRLMADVVQSGRLVAADPVEAAAWRLLGSLEPGAPVPAEDEALRQPAFDDMEIGQVRSAVALARRWGA